MTKKNQAVKANEILEDPNAILDKLKGSEMFFEKNKKAITYFLGGLALVILAFVFYKYQGNQKNEDGQIAMYNSVFAWEKDSLKTALSGDKTDVGLIDAADEFSGSDAGNLASYYAGVALLKEGKYDEAIEQLNNFKSKDLLVQGMAYSLIGDAYLEKKEMDNAVEYYNKAVQYKPNEAFTPKYLMKLALAQELNKDYSSAVESYGKIVDEYPTSSNVNDAKKYKARAEGLSAAK
jgi:TolA-binding protein